MSFDEAVRAHAPDLFRFAFWLSRDRAQAEDIVQEALLRGWRAYPGLRERSSVKAWLFSIVRREFLRARGASEARFESLEEEVLAAVEARSPLFGLEMREALLALPPGYAEPLALQVLGGFSCAEIALELGTTEGAVMTRLTRARQALRRLIAPPEARSRRGESA